MDRKNFRKKYQQLFVFAGLCMLFFYLLFYMLYLFYEKGQFPDGEISKNPQKVTPATVDDRLSHLFELENCDYLLSMPPETFIEYDFLHSDYEDMTFLVVSSDEGDMEKVCREKLLSYLYVPIIGERQKTYCVKKREGYFGDKWAKYGAYKTKVRVSMQEISVFSMCYGILLEEGTWLYLFSRVTDRKDINNAYEMLGNIAYSVKSTNSGEKTNKNMQEMLQNPKNEEAKVPNTDYRIEISLNTEQSYEEGLLLFEWENLSTEPVIESVTFSDGTKATFLEEYSSLGHYVYKFNEIESGVCHISGSTQKTLKNCHISMLELSQYLLLYGGWHGEGSFRVQEGE